VDRSTIAATHRTPSGSTATFFASGWTNAPSTTPIPQLRHRNDEDYQLWVGALTVAPSVAPVVVARYDGRSGDMASIQRAHLGGDRR
jgi:hypothetical protein